MKFSMLAIVAAALSGGVHGFAETPLKSSYAVRSVSRSNTENRSARRDLVSAVNGCALQRLSHDHILTISKS